MYSCRISDGVSLYQDSMRSYPNKRILKITMYPKVKMAVPSYKNQRSFITSLTTTKTWKSCVNLDKMNAVKYLKTEDLNQHFTSPSKLKVDINRCLFISQWKHHGDQDLKLFLQSDLIRILLCDYDFSNKTFVIVIDM